MKHLIKFIEKYKTSLNFIKDNNLVLGGSCVLEFYGLKLRQKPHDLDVILFEELSQNQTLFIETECLPSAEYSTEEEGIHSFLHSDLNIILAKNIKTPLDLPMFKDFKLNSINNIIEAKTSYRMGKSKSFTRLKDVLDLQFIKTENFNFVN